MANHTMAIRTTVSLDNNNIVDKSVEYSSTMPVLVDAEPIAGSATTVIVVAIDVSETEAIVLFSTVAATVKTNSADTPDDTIVLVANEAYVWHTSSLDTSLVTTDVTAMHVVVAGATAGEFTVAAIVDPTPA